MSGTSLDGVDAALVEIEGSGKATSVRLMEFITMEIPSDVKDEIRLAVRPETGRVDLICSLNFKLGKLFAEAAKAVCAKAGMPISRVDYIASHGQTIWHIPHPQGSECLSTLQIGEPAVIAYETGVQVISNFRTMDMAAGGQGAPLVPYSELVLYGSDSQNIALQNIGGIANVTIIPASGGVDSVYAFDTGPGNMVIDEAMQALYGLPYDADGAVAASGSLNEPLCDELAAHPYISQALPKTTGREMFGADFTRLLLSRWRGKMPDEDLIATLTWFTAHCIGENCRRYVLPRLALDRFVISGGGAHNATLVRMIAEQLPGVEVITQEALGFSSDAKEAIAFAVMGNETLNGVASNVPSATGASRPVVLGNVTMGVR